MSRCESTAAGSTRGRTGSRALEPTCVGNGAARTLDQNPSSSTLYFCRSHRSVTVVDGPGDGRRDICYVHGGLVAPAGPTAGCMGACQTCWIRRMHDRQC